MGFLDDLGQAAGAFVSAAADSGSAIIESVAETGASAVESVADAAATVVEEASDLLAGAVEGFANVVGGGLDAVFGAGSGDGVRRAGRGLADVIRRGGRSSGGFIRAAGRMAAGWIRQGGRMLASVIFRIIGPSRLIATHSQWNARSPISGIARSRAEGFNISDVLSQYDYSDSGVYYEFMLNDQGQVQFRRGENVENWRLIVPDRDTYDGVVAGPVAISYQNRRGTGSVEPKHEPGFDIAPAPAFEMIAAGENRIFAKEAGADNFYIAAMVRDFLHFRKQAFDAPVDVPGFYTKLDPEFGTRNARFDDLLLIDKKQYHRHISLANFLLYNIGRRLDPLYPPDRPLPPLLRLLRNVLLRLWDEVRPDMMLVRFDPGIWHLIDSRPPKKSGKLPEWLDSATSYRHVDYGWDWGRAGRIIERSEQSIRFRKVLGMGVGRLHRHTHYTAFQGGELHVLAFNMGPIGDFASFFDGTCNYYLLCQIKEGPLDENRQASLRDAYGLLWIDEQSYYSERWRLVHPGDNKWGSFSRGMVTFAGLPPQEGSDSGYEPYRDAHRYPSDCLLDLERFWCPFRNGFIHAGSRLALARQTCLVSGRVPPDFHDSSCSFKPGEHLLFSLVFSWGSIDRTWRWRRLPPGCRAVILAEEEEKALLSESVSAVELTAGPEDVCYPQLIGLRDDMTITLRGVKTIGGQRQEGYWVQKYLPANNEEVPFLDETAGAAERKDQLSRFGTENLPPKYGYGHAWRFVPKDAFDRIRRYSHWGHYGKVDSRSQYYELFVEANSAVSAAELEAALSRDDHAPRWLDFKKRLSVHYPWLNYSAVEDLFVSGMPTESLFRTTHQPPSFFNEFLYLKILNRPAWPVPGAGRGDGKKGVRFIAVLWDKRDDDLAALQPRPEGPVSLLADFSPDSSPLADRVLTVRLGARRVVWKAPVVQKAVLSVYPGRQCITLNFTSVIQRRPRYLQHWKRIEDYMGMGVDRIAGFLRDSLGLDPEHPLGALDYDRWLQAEIFSREPDAVPFEIYHDPDRVDPCAAAGYPCPDMTIHRVRVQALDQNILFDKFDLPVSVFTGRRRERSGKVEFIFSKTWNFDDRKEFEAVSRFLVEPGIHTHATSVVFEDLVGHVATPESMEFVIRRG